MDAGFSEMRASFNRIDERLDRMQHLMTQFAVAIIVAMVGLYASLAGLFATQL
jgi:hypothetical protein